MQRWQLFDLIRRVSELTDIAEPVIVGSQSLLLDGGVVMMEPLTQRAELVKETAFDGALIPRLERFENHLRSQRHINYNLTPIRELLARLK